MTHRVQALDALRGLAIFAMLLVNNPGSWQHVYAPLLHADWHGLTPTDLVFPGFIFVMGVTLAIQLPKALAASGSKRVCLTALKRGATLVLLGWFLYLFWFNFAVPDYDWINDRLATLRYLGVLQRLGIVYLLTVLLMCTIPPRRYFTVAIGLLVAYWLLMRFVPYSAADGQTYQGLWLHGNSLAAYLDNLILGASHLYYADASPFAFDPEGLLSTVPAVSSCLLGVVAGRYLITDKRATVQTLIVALAGIVIGVALSAWVPVNKALWTPTFVLVTSGIMVCLLWAFMALDTRFSLFKPGHPLLVAGTNSIALYMIAGVLARLLLMIRVDGVTVKYWLYQPITQFIGDPKLASLCFALLFCLICYLPLLWMYRRGIFWRV